MSVEKFRELAALRKVPGASIGARFSTAERRWAVEYARQPGMSANRAARALGISDVTMRIWMRAAIPAATLRPVVVTTEESEPQRRPRAPSKAPTATDVNGRQEVGATIPWAAFVNSGTSPNCGWLAASSGPRNGSMFWQWAP